MKISISKIKAFKSCRRMYWLRYVEGLEPVQKSEALETGSSYHELIEGLNNVGCLPPVEGDWSKELAMAKAYEKYIYPKFHVTEAEKWLEKAIDKEGNVLIGIVDGLADDGHIVEHKTTSQDITEQYEYNLLWDEQILAYMYLTDRRKIWYTVCRKPTIRQRQNESDEEFFDRMVAWYDTDTESKIRLLEIERTDEEVEKFKKDLDNIVYEILWCKWAKEYVEKDTYYRNACHCNVWGRRCEYSGVCLHYDPNQEYVEFTRKETANG